jgi:hypothetical protein
MKCFQNWIDKTPGISDKPLFHFTGETSSRDNMMDPNDEKANIEKTE